MPAPVMVRNNQAGPTVFADEKQHVEWSGAGDNMGGDLQPVPASFLENVQFQRMATRGILTIETEDEAINSAFASHKAEWEQRQQRQQQASHASLDQTPQNDTVVKTCIGPSGKGPDQLCGADVPVKAEKLREQPPLCSMHQELASQFIAQETERLVEGKPEVVWVKTRVAARTRQD